MTLERIDDVLRCVADMGRPERRAAAARTVARHLGADDLIVFVRDADVGRSLPAPGFPQTLRGGRAWRELVKCAEEDGTAEGVVSDGAGELQQAEAMGLADGTVAVLLGRTASPPGKELLTILLPLIGDLLRSEALARRAEAESMLARQSAREAADLAAKLDATRGDLQRALAVADTASRARDEFLATVSHELRTPLTSIIGWLELLREETDPLMRAEGMETIERNAHAQSRLVDDILDFSRINAGKLRLDIRPVELVEVIGRALDVTRPAAEGKEIRLDSVLDPSAGLVSGDPDRLQQVVWNLLSNAVKFTARGGHVQVRLERIDSHCEVTVSDTGEGIPPEFLPFVFDRFSQADSTSTRAHGGLGLGLGIVRQLVELHGGAVAAFSPGVGQGATFAIRLPLLIVHPREGGDAGRVEPPPLRSAGRGVFADYADLSGISVLLVEDNDDARRLLLTILERCGAIVRSAEGAAAALRLLAAGPSDIIISDIEMPLEDGYSFIRKVRIHEAPSARTPAIALTAYTRSVDRVRALEAGFQAHMSKPVDPAELVAAVRSLLTTTSRGEKSR